MLRECLDSGTEIVEWGQFISKVTGRGYLNSSVNGVQGYTHPVGVALGEGIMISIVSIAWYVTGRCPPSSVCTTPPQDRRNIRVGV